MRLRDVRLAILTGLAGILHSTAQALLRQAAEPQAGANQPPAGEDAAARTGGPPQHWLERVKDARVWYGIGAAQKSAPPGYPAPTKEGTTPDAAPGDATRAVGQKDNSLVDEQGTAPTEAKTAKTAPSAQPPENGTTAAAAKETGELPRKEKPAATPPAKGRFRLRLPGSLKTEAGNPVPPEKQIGTAHKPPETTAADKLLGQLPPAADAAAAPDLTTPPFPAVQVNSPERDYAGTAIPEQTLHPASSPPSQHASLRFETPRPTSGWTRKTERGLEVEEPVPMERPAAFPGADAAASETAADTAAVVPASPARTPAMRGNSSPPEQAQMPVSVPNRARQLAEQAAPQQQTHWTQSSGGRWLDLPADPTAERDLEAEREAWEADLREQRHEQKLAREQRGDLWSA